MTESLDTGKIIETFKVARHLSAVYGLEPLLMKDDYDMLEAAPLCPEDLIGSHALIEGSAEGVTHRIDIRFFDEMAAVSPHFDGELVDIRINAAEGDSADPVDENQGAINGLLWVRKDQIWVDLGFGTVKSKSSEVQNRLNDVVGYFGIPSEIFENPQAFYLGPGQTEALIEGLGRLATENYPL